MLYFNKQIISRQDYHYLKYLYLCGREKLQINFLVILRFDGFRFVFDKYFLNIF